MNKKYIAFLILFLLAGSVFFYFWHNGHTARPEATSGIKIFPKATETKPAEPDSTSPFDKPNVDPLAATFKKLPKTTIKFDRYEYDFDTVPAGQKVATKFHFTNTGKADLVITNALASCGCTVPKWPKEPIAPEKDGVIDVVFSSKTKGKVKKDVQVLANTDPPTTTLIIRSTIIPNKP